MREQLLSADGVLVWVDPIHQGKTRAALDPLLRDVASRGPWVSAHPDVILKMGVKEVLHRTKHLGWGTDTHLYRSAAEFAAAFPSRLQSSGPRVLKQNRGNGGQGVWKVELVSDQAGAARSCACCRRSAAAFREDMRLEEFMTRCEPYFDADGCIVDQPFQPRLPDGMIRCYMGADKVVGFGHQLIKALIPPPPEGPDSPAAQPGPRIMHGADAAPFQTLRAKMEDEWTPQMMQRSRHRRRIPADHLGRRFPLWAAHRLRRGQLTFCARSMSVRASRSPTRRRRRLPCWQCAGYAKRERRAYVQGLNSGFPKTAGIKSSRNNRSCARAPTERPAAPLSGMIASAATCQVTATYERPGFIVAKVLVPGAEFEGKLDQRNKLVERLLLRKLAGRESVGQVERAEFDRQAPMRYRNVASEHRSQLICLRIQPDVCRGAACERLFIGHRTGNAERAQPSKVVGKITESLAKENAGSDQIRRIGTCSLSARASDAPGGSGRDQYLM